jgi:hypothetical protein
MSRHAGRRSISRRCRCRAGCKRVLPVLLVLPVLPALARVSELQLPCRRHVRATLCSFLCPVHMTFVSQVVVLEAPPAALDSTIPASITH